LTKPVNYLDLFECTRRFGIFIAHSPTSHPNEIPPSFSSHQTTSTNSHNMSTINNNIYKDDIDFAALALTDAEFAKV
jgi:hypothetical protein